MGAALSETLYTESGWAAAVLHSVMVHPCSVCPTSADSLGMTQRLHKTWHDWHGDGLLQGFMLADAFQPLGHTLWCGRAVWLLSWALEEQGALVGPNGDMTFP